MDELLLTLLLWSAFLLMLWALRLGLNHVEASLESDEEQPRGIVRDRASLPSFDQSDAATDVIGYYMGATIHRSIISAGVEYRYDRIESFVGPPHLQANERCLAPGIVYVARP